MTIQSEPVRLRDQELQFARARQEKINELAAAEEAGGATLLQGGNEALAALSRQTGTLRSDIAAHDSAIGMIRKTRPAAIVAEFHRRAAQIREQAQTKRREREKIISKTRGLLDQLSQLEGVKFDRGILHAQCTGGWMEHASVLGPEYRVDDRGPDETYRDIGCGYALPQSRVLLDQAIGLEAEADQLDQGELTSHGNAEAATIGELVAAVYSDPLRLFPSAPDIEAWAQERAREFFQRRGLAPGAAEPVRLRLVWEHGSISPTSAIQYRLFNGAIAA